MNTALSIMAAGAILTAPHDVAPGFQVRETTPAPREGVEWRLAPKAVIPSAPDRLRQLFAVKVEAAWLLAGGLGGGSEAEAGS